MLAAAQVDANPSLSGTPRIGGYRSGQNPSLPSSSPGDLAVAVSAGSIIKRCRDATQRAGLSAISQPGAILLLRALPGRSK